VGLLTLLLAIGVLATPLPTDALCLWLVGEPGRIGWRVVTAGDEVRLRFRHSLWGSLVQEEFRVAADGFELVQLRYAEARLAEYYGHEAARREGDWWVVAGDRRRLRTLTLRRSRDSELELSVGSERMALWNQVGPGDAIRLAVTACEGK
jgi:hypothetical protein